MHAGVTGGGDAPRTGSMSSVMGDSGGMQPDKRRLHDISYVPENLTTAKNLGFHYPLNSLSDKEVTTLTKP